MDDRSRQISFTQCNKASRLAHASQLADGFDGFWDVREDLAGVDDVEVVVVVWQGGHIGDFKGAVGGQVRLCSSFVDGCLDGVDSDDLTIGDDSRKRRSDGAGTAAGIKDDAVGFQAL